MIYSMEENLNQLLLKDLCARLSYGVKVAFFNEDLTYHSEPKTLTGIECINNLNYSSLEDEDGNTTIVEFVKPYLFPLSSMTEEERIAIGNEFAYGQPHKAMDTLHKRHIDYRGLIPKGLAIDATGKNIY